MSFTADAEQDPGPSLIASNADWRVTAVQPLDDYRLKVSFRDGLTGEVDLAPMLSSERAGVFVPLRVPQRFREAYLEGGVVTWPGGLDLAPDAMYDEIKARGCWVIS